MCDVFERSIDHWRSTGAPVRPPASEAQIEETFATLNFPLTDEVRRWYSLADGFDDVDQSSCFWWWPLERIREENQHPDRDADRLWFADFLIDSHRYCLGRSQSTFSEVWIDNDPFDQLSDPGVFARLRVETLRLFGTTYDISDDWKYQRYRKLAETIADYLEKYLHNPEDVEILDLSS